MGRLRRRLHVSPRPARSRRIHCTAAILCGLEVGLFSQGTWTALPRLPGDPRAADIKALAPDGIWVLDGETRAYHRDGTRWTAMDLPATVTALDGFASDDLWAVGSRRPRPRGPRRRVRGGSQHTQVPHRGRQSRTNRGSRATARLRDQGKGMVPAERHHGGPGHRQDPRSRLRGIGEQRPAYKVIIVSLKR